MAAGLARGGSGPSVVVIAPRALTTAATSRRATAATKTARSAKPGEPIGAHGAMSNLGDNLLAAAWVICD
jgi:hypothetical protein